jgi:hypothetical protein
MFQQKNQYSYTAVEVSALFPGLFLKTFDVLLRRD